MSGRLVILRHKKWNVWNQDNVEKVVRDERIEREKQDSKKSKEKNSFLDKQRTILNQEENNDKKHVNLFEPDELSNLDQEQHEEYKKEKEEKEIKRLKRDGVAPWSLSEGNNVIPWYAKLPKQNKNEDELVESKKIKSSSSSSSLKIENQVKSSNIMNKIDQLRMKRIAREKVEHQRAAALLAEYDIYGNERNKIKSNETKKLKIS